MYSSTDYDPWDELLAPVSITPLVSRELFLINRQKALMNRKTDAPTSGRCRSGLRKSQKWHDTFEFAHNIYEDRKSGMPFKQLSLKYNASRNMIERIIDEFRSIHAIAE